MTRERAILRFLDELEPVQLHGFRLSLRGEALAEGYFAPFDAKTPHRLYSVSKSVVSLAIGLLAGDRKLSLSDRIVDHFPEYCAQGAHPMLRGVTIENMLMMATCYDRAMYKIEDDDWTRPFFEGEPTHPAGLMFHYDTSASQVMCALVEKLTGEEILSFMQRRLFDALGMTGEKRWLKDGAGVSQGGTGLLMTLSDFSKLADFCMSDGRGLLDAAYLRRATSRLIATDERSGPEERYGYGYQFWQMRRGFAMYGMAGQMALCLPRQQLSLCTTGDTLLSSVGVQPIYDAFFRHLDGIEALPSSKEDARELAARLDSLALRPQKSGMEGGRSVHIRLEAGGLPFDALDILPQSVTFFAKDKPMRLPCGDGAWLQGIFPGSEQRCIASGGWETDRRYILRCELNGDFACGMEMYVSLDEERVAVRISSSMWECIPGWDGLGWGTVQTTA